MKYTHTITSSRKRTCIPLENIAKIDIQEMNEMWMLCILFKNNDEIYCKFNCTSTMQGLHLTQYDDLTKAWEDYKQEEKKPQKK